MAADRSLTDPWMLGSLHGAQPRAARAAGRHRQLVRAPAGQALRRGDGGLGDGLLARDPPRQREDLHGDAAHRPARARGAGRCRSSCSAKTPAMMRSAARARGAPGRRRDRHQHGLPGAEGAEDGRRRRAAGRPRPGGRGGARDGRGRQRRRAVARGRRIGVGGMPVTVKLRSGLRPGDTGGFELAHRLVEEAGVAAIAFHPRSAPCITRASPTTSSPRAWWQSLPAPVILTGGLSDARSVREAFAATGAAAVMLARGALGNPWLFAQLLRGRELEPSPRGGPGRAATGRSSAPSSTSASSAPRATCASSTPGTCPACSSSRAPPSACRNRCRRRPTLVQRAGAAGPAPAAFGAGRLRPLSRAASPAPAILLRSLTACRPARSPLAAGFCVPQPDQPTAESRFRLTPCRRTSSSPPKACRSSRTSSSCCPPRSAARSPSASRRRASSATSPRTPSTTTPRTSRRWSRAASPSCRRSCAWRPSSRPRTSRPTSCRSARWCTSRTRRRASRSSTRSSARPRPSRTSTSSPTSRPSGRALLGRKRNETVAVKVPRGPARKLKITKIDVGLE